MGVLYSANETEAEQVDIDSDDGALRISKSIRNNMTPLSAMSMLIFVLLYMPCLASIIAIKGESGKWKWALFVVVYTIALAWVSSTLVFQLGSLII